METKVIPPKAALLVIGNEILSGKVKDENTPYLAQELFNLGWELREIRVVGDDKDDIVDAIQSLSKKYDHLFTSGGVGPTHDDVTLDAVAAATDRKLVLSPMLERILMKHYKTDILSPSQQRLARIPEGATLHYGTASLYPQAVIENIYPLPGIPSLFRKKFEELKSLWPEVEAPSRRCFKLVADETQLAAFLDEIQSQNPEVSLGSYPTQVKGIWHLELVLESRIDSALDKTTLALRKVLTFQNMEWQES